jgi:hypothetical protein
VKTLIKYVLAVAVAVSCCPWGGLSAQSGPAAKPKKAKEVTVAPRNWVPDARCACEVAKAVLRPIVGPEEVRAEIFQATLRGDKWIVRGSVPRVDDVRGGATEVHISRKTCEVLLVRLDK